MGVDPNYRICDPQGSSQPTVCGVCHPSMPHARCSAQMWLAAKTVVAVVGVFQSFSGRMENAIHTGEGAGRHWIWPVGRNLETTAIKNSNYIAKCIQYFSIFPDELM